MQDDINKTIKVIPVIKVPAVNSLLDMWIEKSLVSGFLACLFLFVSLFPQIVFADYPTLGEISLGQTQQLFVDADELGPQESDIIARPVYAKGQLIGYLALSHEIIKIWGYSKKPIAILIGIDIDAHIAGANILYHKEPILVAGIKEEQLHDFVKQFEGKHANTMIRVDAYNREGYEGVDGISGATITVMVLNRSIMGTAKKVASVLGLPRVFNASEEGAEPVNEEVTGTMATAAEELPVWEYNWRENAIHLVTMGLALSTLLAILFLQDMLVKRIRLFNIVRISFLLFTAFYIGFWQMAQLSIINILAFSKTIFDGFSWYALMFDFPFYSPLIFMLWAFIALVSLLWGGGVFCGWLCPFGALQELIGKAAKKFKVPSFEFPTMIHERLLAIKYFILIGMIGFALESFTYLAYLVEIEPFKTTFVLRFQRTPIYVIYAVGLLIISAFNTRFYCKYLCPLGAALNFITHFRVFDWLRRRKECGHPCQACAIKCQVNAIKPTSEINSTECLYCLDCQVYYWDEHACTPLMEREIRRAGHLNRRDGARLG